MLALMDVLISWLVSAAALWCVARILPGFEVKDPKAALWVAVVVGVLNALLGWLLTGVIWVTTLGIMYFFSLFTQILVLAIILKLAAALTSSLKIRSFWDALLAALILTGLTAIASRLLGTSV